MVKTSLISRLSEIFEEKSKLSRLSRLASLYEAKCIKTAQADPFAFLDENDEELAPQPQAAAPQQAPALEFVEPQQDDDPFGFIESDDDGPEAFPPVEDFSLPEPEEDSPEVKKLERQVKGFLGSDYGPLIEQQIEQQGSKAKALQFLYDNYRALYEDLDDLGGESLDNYNEGGDDYGVTTSDDIGADSYDDFYGSELGYDTPSSEPEGLQQGIQDIFEEGAEKGSEDFIAGTTVTRSKYDKNKYDRMRSLVNRKAINPVALFNVLGDRDYDDLSDAEKAEVIERVTSPPDELTEDQKQRWIAAKENKLEEFRARQRGYQKTYEQKTRNVATEEGAKAIDFKNAYQRAKNQMVKLFEITRAEAAERVDQEIARRVGSGQDKVQAARALYNELKNQAAVQKLIEKFVTKYMKKHPDASEEQVRAAVSGKSAEEIKEIMKQHKIR